jgi:TolB protein
LALAGGAGGFGPAASERLESPPNGPEDDGEIWAMAGDGSAQTRLIVASDGYDLGSAAWSPDGSQFAFTRAKSPSVMGVTSEDVDIWLASADGSNQRPLVEDAGWQWIPHWTPDGEWLLYTVDGPRGPGGGAGLSAPFFGWLQGPAAGQPPSVAPEVDVWRVRVDGRGQPERVTDSPADDRAGVASPDGRWILFDSTREEGRPGIYVMRADGTDVRRATFFGDDWGGTWSPDGTRIAFNSEQGNSPEDIYIVEFPGVAPPTRLTDDPERDRAPCFSPDGTRIAFYSSRDDEDEIWSMAADGTDLRNLTRTPGAAEYLVPGGGCWGPDGQILYQRSADAAASASALVREDLAVVGTLLQAVLLAIVTLAIIRLGAPFGAVALILGLATAIWVVENGAWQFVIAAMVAGLLADVVIRLAPTHRKAAFGGASAAAALVISASAAALATTGLAWSPSLTLGATIAAAAVGWGLSGLIAPARRPDVEVGGD